MTMQTVTVSTDSNEFSYAAQGRRTNGSSGYFRVYNADEMVYEFKASGSVVSANAGPTTIEVCDDDGTTILKTVSNIEYGYPEENTGSFTVGTTATTYTDDQWQEAQKCLGEYKTEFNKIYNYYDNGNGVLETASGPLTGQAKTSVQTDLVNFITSHAATADNAYTLKNSKITCHKDRLKSDWDQFVSAHGLTNAPTLDGTYTPLNPGTGGGGTDVPQTEATCHSTSGALGWILCPVLEGAADAAQWAYTNVVEPSLKTDVSLFSTTGDRAGTFAAWGIFRDLANIFFVIFLLFVILSQLTGIGIDNYGIKKTLPKLAIAAILVNLSFYICQAAVDLSNIAGSSVYGLITNIAQTRVTIPAGSAVMSSGGSIAMGIITIVAAAGIGTLIGGVTFWGWIGGALFAFIPTLIGVVVAILFLFLLLAMRQAIVVICVAISPLAFVCYTLPNTKNLFNRWRMLLQGMLLLYPIAALLMAGGRLTARIIFASGASDNNIAIILTAMAAEIAPLFFIPTVVRNAYRATGQIGAHLNAISLGARRGARNAAQGSAAFQHVAGRIRAANATKVMNRLVKSRAGGRGSIPISGLAGYRYTQAQAIAGTQTSQYAANYANADKMTLARELDQSLKKLDPQRFAAAFRELLKKGGEKEALDALYNNGDAVAQANMRLSVERETGATNNILMREYAKYRGNGGNHSFKDFVRSGEASVAVNKKGETALANASKDTYEFISGNATAFTGNAISARNLDAAVLARAATSATASDQADKLAPLLRSLDDARQQAVANRISIAGSATMFDSLRTALASNAGRGNDVANVNQRFNVQFTGLRSQTAGPGIYDYANIRSQMQNDVIAKYGL